MKTGPFICLLVGLAVLSCSKKTVPVPVPDGREYYPVQPGRFVEYQVDSIVYSELPRDTFVYSYRLKVKIADQFTDNAGKPAWRLERFVKWPSGTLPFDSIPWRLKEVWMLLPDDRRLLVSESNTPFTRLIFPVEEKAGWNGNAFNTRGQQMYYYEYSDRTETVNGHAFNRVLRVNQQEDQSLIHENTAWEKYAAGVGLVERHTKDIKSNNVVPGKSVSERIESGMTYHQIVVSYGME